MTEDLSFSALALSRKICARAQNLLSTADFYAHFCAHFKILESFIFTLIEKYCASRQAFMGNISLILKE